MNATFVSRAIANNRTIQLTLTFLVLFILAAVIAPVWLPNAYNQISDAQYAPPDSAHWIGTDLHGRDLLARLLQGLRISLLVGFVGAGVSLGLGVAYGMISGYLGGKLDSAMMRLVDVLYSVPRLIVVILLIASLEKPLKFRLDAWNSGAWIPQVNLLLLFVGLGLVEWLTMARIVRGQVLSLKETGYIQAALVLGQSHFKILIKHLLPNLSGIIIVYLTLTIPIVILEESFLSFLGLGVQAPAASLGTLIADGALLINPLKTYWWLLVFPAGTMTVLLLTLNFLGDALRDALDPRTTP